MYVSFLFEIQLLLTFPFLVWGIFTSLVTLIYVELILQLFEEHTSTTITHWHASGYSIKGVMSFLPFGVIAQLTKRKRTNGPLFHLMGHMF